MAANRPLALGNMQFSLRQLRAFTNSGAGHRSSGFTAFVEQRRHAIGRAGIRSRDGKGCFLFYSEGDKKDAEMDNFLKKEGFWWRFEKNWKRWGGIGGRSSTDLFGGLRLFDLTFKDVAIYKWFNNHSSISKACENPAEDSTGWRQ